MIIKDGKELRNLQEQVLANKNNIEKIVESSELINDYGLHIVGTVRFADQLPDPRYYDGTFGDCYAVGTLDDYEIYILTRPFEGEGLPSWFNLGKFPAPGPQGKPGPEGPKGPQGERGSKWYIDNKNPVVDTDNQFRDVALNTNDGSVFYFDGYGWFRVGSIAGPQGIQGIQGLTGPIGPQGIQGDKGEQGNPGKPFFIKAVLDNVNKLPDPATLEDNIAYIVGTAPENYKLYVQVNGTKWVNMGRIESIPGPKGDTGPQGPIGLTGPQGPRGEKGATGEQGVMGPRGLEGQKGETGPAGPVGPVGPEGKEGPRGPQGLKGDKGDIGPHGPTLVKVAGKEVVEMEFTSDPQAQIDTIEGDIGSLDATKVGKDYVDGELAKKQNKLPQNDLDNIAMLNNLPDKLAAKVSIIDTNYTQNISLNTYNKPETFYVHINTPKDAPKTPLLGSMLVTGYDKRFLIQVFFETPSSGDINKIGHIYYRMINTTAPRYGSWKEFANTENTLGVPSNNVIKNIFPTDVNKEQVYTYIAPANGYIYVNVNELTANKNNYWFINNKSKDMQYGVSKFSYSSASVMFPVGKGDVIDIKYSSPEATQRIWSSKFVYGKE